MKLPKKKRRDQIPAMHFYEAMHVPELFKPFLKPSPKTWEGWGVVDAAVEGKADFILADPKRLDLFRQCTKLENPPDKPVREFYCVSSRRSGKSFYAACKAIDLALFHDWTPYLSAGEVGVIQIVSSDRAQSQVIFRYISGILNGNPYFRQYIQNEFKESMELSNRVVIEVMSCSYRSIRGRSVLASLLDEACFFMSEGRRTDRELVQAIRPSMMTIPNSKLITISSAYAKTGVVYEMWKDYFGKANDSVLIWQSDSLMMNPTLDKGLIDIELKKDPSAARSEFFSEWRADISGAFDPDMIKACAVLPGEMGPRPFQVYSAFVDPSGGSRVSGVPKKAG